MGIVENCAVLILDRSDVPRLGLTALLALETMLKDTLAQRRQVFLVTREGQVQQRLYSLKVVQQLPLIYKVASRQEALRRALPVVQNYATVAEPAKERV